MSVRPETCDPTSIRSRAVKDQQGIHLGQHLILMSVHRSGEHLDDTGMLGEVGTDSALG